jgi:hypothetical protein
MKQWLEKTYFSLFFVINTNGLVISSSRVADEQFESVPADCPFVVCERNIGEFQRFTVPAVE